MRHRNETNEPATASKKWLVVLAVLATAGILVSVDLAFLHWQVHNIAGHESFCAISEGVNCDTVAMSPASVVLRLPVALWAVLFYLLALVLSLWGLMGEKEAFPRGLLFTLFSLSLSATVYLALVSHLLIKSLCILCLTLYLINILSALFAWLALKDLVCGRKIWLLLLFLMPAIGAGIFMAAFFGVPGTGAVFAGGVILLLGATVWMVFGAGTENLRSLGRIIFSDLRFLFTPVWRGVALMVLAAALLGVLWAFYPKLYRDQGAAFASEGNLVDGVTDDGHPWIGSKNPLVTVFEYSDYECPFCREAHQLIRTLVRENQDWLRLVHVHAPLDMACNPMIRRPFHRHACDCARAAICAQQAGFFWKMNDALFARRCNLDQRGLVELAAQLGLERDAFRQCLEKPETVDRLKRDVQECLSVARECRQSGLDFGTPVFIAGDEVVVGLKERSFWEDLLGRMKEKARQGKAQ
jgi:protein-disulfide isomerase/uncharacterized membrane protein